MYNVSTRHIIRPVDDFIESAAKNVMHIHLRPKAEGDVLVFMPGSDEIEQCCDLLRRASKELKEDQSKVSLESGFRAELQLEVLPLYANLPPEAQIRIFGKKKPDTRRIIVATNIAETSITIPGVVFVVDTGFKKEKEYIFRTSGGKFVPAGVPSTSIL